MTAEPWTVVRTLAWTADYLRERGIDGPRLEAELLLADLLDLDRVGLYLQHDRPLNAAEREAYRERVGRRARREPLSYILGRTEFWSLELRVDPAVLIPRPETELLVEEALSRAPAAARILDVGTGSGALAVALATELPRARLVALDLSAAALDVAGENVRYHGLAERVELCRGDLRELPVGPFDLIVSNPPYIPTADIAGLMPEVREFEPRQALDGGADGLEAVRALLAQAASRLRPGGWLLLEVGIGQAEAVLDLVAGAGLVEPVQRQDYGGIPRIVGGRLPEGEGAAGG